MPTIALVDDDRNILTSVSIALEAEGYRIMTYTDGASALEGFKTSPPDLAILDIKMPRMDGMETLRRMRQKSDTPVIFLTSKDDEVDEALGLAMGADDYIPKPFNPLELIARIKAQLRRSTKYNEGAKGPEDIIDFGGLVLNKTSHECVYNEQLLTLTPIEFDILWLLCENRGKVISSEELFESVWHESYYKNSNNTVMVHIRHLREKMSGPTGKSDFIKTVWGVGYKVEE